MKQKTITLSPSYDHGCWIATYDDVETLRMFGTLHIPTAFTLRMEGAEVQERIEKLNPDHTVILNTSGRHTSLRGMPLAAVINSKAFGLNEPEGI
jgi:hypothetical protein